MRPLILLSPAKSLNFDGVLSTALAAAAPTAPAFAQRADELVAAAASLSRAELKKLFGVSDALAVLNHERFKGFHAQSERIALGAFEGQAYKGLDAPSLTAAQIK